MNGRSQVKQSMVAWWVLASSLVKGSMGRLVDRMLFIAVCSLLICTNNCCRPLSPEYIRVDVMILLWKFQDAQTTKAAGFVFARGRDKGLSQYTKRRGRKHVEFCRISKCYDLPRNNGRIGGMLTALGKVILETMLQKGCRQYGQTKVFPSCCVLSPTR